MSITAMVDNALHRNYPDVFLPAPTEGVVGMADSAYNRAHPRTAVFGTAPERRGDLVATFNINLPYRDAAAVTGALEGIAGANAVGIKLASTAYTPDSVVYTGTMWGGDAGVEQAVASIRQVLEARR